MKRLLLVWVATVTAVAGCGVNPVRIQPPESTSDTIDVVIEFSSALNLPAGAKVGFDGSDVGKIRDVRLDKNVVAVIANLHRDVTIPDDCTAAIVQDTLLGDTYVSLTRPPGGGRSSPPLTNGAHIPIAHTRPPSSVEDTLVTLSSFLGGGALQQFQTSLRRIHGVLPKTDDETRRLATTLSADLRGMADDSQEVDRTLDNLSRMSTSLSNRADYLQDVFSDSSVDFWNKAFTGISGLVAVVLSLYGLVSSALWLVPFLDSISTAMEQVGVSDNPDQPGFTDQAVNFTAQTLLPFLADPRVSIAQVTTPDGTDRTADTERVLRSLGMTR